MHRWLGFFSGMTWLNLLIFFRKWNISSLCIHIDRWLNLLNKEHKVSNSCSSVVPKIQKHAVQFPVLCFRAGRLLISTVPSLVNSEVSSWKQKYLSFKRKKKQATKSILRRNYSISHLLYGKEEFEDVSPVATGDGSAASPHLVHPWPWDRLKYLRWWKIQSNWRRWVCSSTPQNSNISAGAWWVVAKKQGHK